MLDECCNQFNYGLNFSTNSLHLEDDFNFLTQADGASEVVGEPTTVMFTIKNNVPLP